jgi:hypothetical protein
MWDIKGTEWKGKAVTKGCERGFRAPEGCCATICFQNKGMPESQYAQVLADFSGVSPYLAAREGPLGVRLRLAAVRLLPDPQVRVRYLRAIDTDEPHPLVAAVQADVEGVPVGDRKNRGRNSPDLNLRLRRRRLRRTGGRGGDTRRLRGGSVSLRTGRRRPVVGPASGNKHDNQK